jgi:alkanesulfonate monooxygenase SsuD/methylene tetrahydromethanopterin reductase-like flavin-dependent oxidoreductase (luciferase family)
VKELEVGIQFHLPTHASITTRDIRSTAEACVARGVDQLWFTDNLGSRSLFVVLAAVASLPVRIGSAVLVQYFRSPVEAAAAFATVSELMEGAELSVGLGRGNPRTHESIEMPRAIGFMRETARMLRSLLAGEELRASDYPLVARHFHFVDGARLRLVVRPARPVRVYGGGSGPLGVKAAHELMEGMILNGTMFMPALQLGRLPSMVDAHPAPDGFRRVADLKIAVDRDAKVARNFARTSVAQRMISLRKSGIGDDDFAALGIDPAGVDRLEAELAAGRPAAELRPLVSDAMVDAVFVAGDPAACRERLAEVAESSRALGIHQLMFSEVGPDPTAAIPLLLDEVVAAL